MKEEKYLQLLNNREIDKLKELLEGTIRDNIAIKSNSKTRISAIKKLQKINEKNGRYALLGYGKIKDLYAFTDSYRLYFLKDNLGYEENIKFPSMDSFVEFDKSDDKIINLDLEDILYFYKTHKSKEDIKNNPYKIKGIDKQGYNIEYLKEMIDTLGTNLKVYNQGELRPLYFINDKEEIGLLLPIKLY
jgi:hypothetical protein